MTTREIVIRDRRTGEETVRTVTGYRYDKDNVFWTDAGFDYNPGAVAMADNILRERIRGLKDPALYEQARQAINNSTARHEGFAAVVEGWQKDKVIRKRAAILGIMGWQELLHARAQGADAGGVVVFADDRLQHAGRGVHQTKGTAGLVPHHARQRAGHGQKNTEKAGEIRRGGYAVPHTQSPPGGQPQVAKNPLTVSAGI